MAYAEAEAALARRGVRVWVLSTADAEGAEALLARTSIPFPLSVDLPMEATAAKLGLFYEERRHILHAGAFLFDADGRIALAVTSTGAVGRLMPDELLRLLDFWRDQRQASTKE